MAKPFLFAVAVALGGQRPASAALFNVCRDSTLYQDNTALHCWYKPQDYSTCQSFCASQHLGSVCQTTSYQPSCADCPLSTDCAPILEWYAVDVYPHDQRSFLQGLVYNQDGTFYEGTGMLGQSGVKKVTRETGAVVAATPNEYADWGEGIAVVGNRLYQLTWTTGKVLVYNKDTLTLMQTLPMSVGPKEGWGLAYDGTHLIQSDGSSNIFFIDPTSLVVKRKVRVMDGKLEVAHLNELEFIKGVLWANVWQTNRIYAIDPATGKVLAMLELDKLASTAQQDFKPSLMQPQMDVLNGIAWDEAKQCLLVSGKFWPKIYCLKLQNMPGDFPTAAPTIPPATAPPTMPPTTAPPTQPPTSTPVPTPPATLPASAGTCVGQCGKSAVGALCWCDTSCALNGDCCSDYVTTCFGSTPGATLPPAAGPPSQSCNGYCNKQAPPGCWCDAACVGSGDCCPDFGFQCQALAAIVGTVVTPTPTLPPVSNFPPGTCVGKCNGKSSLTCYCDAACTANKDCCVDYVSVCSPTSTTVTTPVAPATPVGSCSGKCGGKSNLACYCDQNCATYGDCCADKNTFCPNLMR